MTASLQREDDLIVVQLAWVQLMREFSKCSKRIWLVYPAETDCNQQNHDLIECLVRKEGTKLICSNGILRNK